MLRGTAVCEVIDQMKATRLGQLWQQIFKRFSRPRLEDNSAVVTHNGTCRPTAVRCYLAIVLTIVRHSTTVTQFVADYNERCWLLVSVVNIKCVYPVHSQMIEDYNL